MKNGRLPITRQCIFSQARNHHPPSQQNLTAPRPQDYLTHPGAATLSVALQHYIDSENPSQGQKIHAHILKTGFRPNANISIKLLILYLKSCCLSYARRVFDEMPQPTVSAYNYMVSGYLKDGRAEESLGMVRRMVACNQKPDGFTFSMILKASTLGNDCVSSLQSCNLGKEVHAQMLKSDVEFDDVLCTALVNSYVRSRLVCYARTVFDEMLEKNVICSTSMITGYMNRGAIQDAEEVFARTTEKDVVVFNAMIEGYSRSAETAWRSLELFIDMQRLNFQPTISTFASVIGTCSLLAAFEVGQQVQTHIVKTELLKDIRMASALIDMYAKCGRIKDARKIFDHMPEKNVFSWTSMIDGYGKNGDSYEAIKLFSIMQDCRIIPNYVTFLAVLSACGHAGLVAKGRKIFDSMGELYLLKPKMEHYACMVDLLGRAGSVQQAWEFMMNMPEEPNTDVWAALLSSSWLHGDVEMARVASNQIFKLNSGGRPGAYLALSNTFATAGNWENVSKLRDVMKVRGISKNTGCSWVGAESGAQ